MSITAATFRSDKRCGKSGIPDKAKCSKQTSAKSTPGPELKERAFAVASVVQGARAARSYVTGNKGRAVKQLLSAGKNAAEYAQERGERTGNKRLLTFATGKNLVESANAAGEARKAFKSGNWQAAAFNISEAANTSLEAYTFNRQRQGRKLSNWEEQNRNFGDLLQAQKWVSAAQGQYKQRRPLTNNKRRKPTMTGRSSWRGYNRSLLDSITAGDFRSDKKCGASGIPDTAKCTKGVGRPVAQQKKSASAPKRNIIQKIGRKISGAEKREKREATIAALKKKYGANSPEANGGEKLSPNGATYKWIKKNRPDLDPEKIGGNSPLAMEIAEKLDSMDLTSATFRDDACWKGYVQKGTKRKGNRTVPNCVPVGKAKAEVKRKTGQDGEDKLTKSKRKVWAEGF